MRTWQTAPQLDLMDEEGFRLYAQMCGWTLARAHARSGSPKAIACYLGSGRAFAAAMVEFAGNYAAQNQCDYRDLLEAIKSGRVAVPEASASDEPVDL